MIVRPPNVPPAHKLRLKRTLTRLLDRAQQSAERTAIGLHRTIITQDGTVNPPIIPDLAGDVIGSIIANTIALIRGTPVSGVPPTDGQVLVFNEDSGLAEWGAPGDPSGTIIDYSSLINEARVVRGATATASSEASVERVAEYAIDSDDATFWLTEPENAPTDPSAGAWLRVDLGQAREITYYRVVQPAPTQFRATSSKLQSSTDDATWTDQVTFGIFGDSGLEALPSPVTARYWRMLGVETDPLLFALNYWGLATLAVYSGQPTILGGNDAGTDTRLVSGGQVTWVSGLTFDIAAGTGYINGSLVTWAAQQVTLDAADPTDPRIDVIYVGTDALADSITGTASADPSEPVTDPGTQLKLALVTVAAGATAPTVTTELVYAENAGDPAEWDWATSGSGWTLNSTNNPRGGTIDIEGTTVAATAYVQGERGTSTIDPTDYAQLVLYLRFKAAWGTNRFLQVTLRNAGVQVGNALRVSSGFFGLDQTNTTTYQAVIIPTLQFAAAPGAVVNQVRIQALGTGGTAIGVYLDDISFTTGGTTPVGGDGLSQAEADARYAQRANNLSDLASAATARANIGAAAITHTHADLATDAELAAHAAAGDPHPLYALDTDLTTHAAAADPHAGYVLESLIDAKGDLLVGSADNTPARLPVGTDGQIPYADATQATGIRWGDAPAGVGLGYRAWVYSEFSAGAFTYVVDSNGDPVYAIQELESV
jgi:hypothetical protein